jgi:tetratricopeptide (TPR) repeat protein
MVSEKKFPGPRSESAAATALVAVLLVAATAVAFGRTIAYDFINFDDGVYVRNNSHVVPGLTVSGATWALTRRHSSNWHPLTWMSHMLDCQIYGLKPWGHHLTNLLLHAATSVALFLVFRKMTGAFWPSALVAAIFAVHPLRVESVAWIAERKDVLSGLLFMLTLGAYRQYAVRPFSPWRYSAVMVLFALGLTAKPMLVTLPCVLLLLDYWPLGRIGGATRSSQREHSGGRFGLTSRVVLEKLPLFALSALSSAATLWAQQDALFSLDRRPLDYRLANALVSYVAYLGQMVVPVGLAILYPVRAYGLLCPKALLSALVLGGLTAAAVWQGRRFRYLPVGWFWYLGTLVPVIGLVQVGGQAMADRYTYLTQIGLYLILAFAGFDLTGRWPSLRVPLGVGATAATVGLMFLAVRQSGYWRDNETLWRRALACTSDNWIAHEQLGGAYMDRQAYRDARRHFEQSLAIHPYLKTINNLGVAADKLGDSATAAKCYAIAVQLESRPAEAHLNLGNLLRKNYPERAIAEYQRALEIDPNYAAAHNNLGAALAKIDAPAAVGHYRRALELDPENADAHNNLGNILHRQGRLSQAINYYRRALEIRPNFPLARQNLQNTVQELHAGGNPGR